VGYSGVKGGMDAILAAERLVRRKRAVAPWPATAAIIGSYRLAVDRIMGESGLYDEATAADAFRQAEGDLLEAAHLVRAYRSALPRLALSTATDAGEMRVLRRIVPASRTPGGPQLLGRTTDYTARVLERPDGPPPAPVADPEPETGSESPATAAPGTTGPDTTGPDTTAPETAETAETAARERADPRRPPRFYEQLLKADLAVRHEEAADDPEPFDVSRGAARPPAPRSAVLASMARAETGALVALWYRSIRGPDGAFHEVTLGELRHGRLPVRVIHPLTGHAVEIGQIRATEAEAVEDLDGPAEDRTRLDVGYGLCFGHNERKAIAMANLDIAFRRAAQSDSTGDELEQLLLLTTDGLDSSGFLEHLKLPHYVTFRSIVDRKLASRAARADSERAAGPGERGQDDGPGADGAGAGATAGAGAGAGDTGDWAGPPAREMGRREKSSLRSEEISR
jgi:alpha-D-ribose 1-methylphosphonate 5-triphosphate synthase subunit PhnI